jgi:hypothetical protein
MNECRTARRAESGSVAVRNDTGMEIRLSGRRRC